MRPILRTVCKIKFRVKEDELAGGRRQMKEERRKKLGSRMLEAECRWQKKPERKQKTESKRHEGEDR
jgi:hypothetical protein